MHKTAAHSNSDEFKCHFEGCGQRFTTKKGLLYHKLIHLGEKPFKCEFNDCDKRFRNKSNLRSHLKCKHSGDELN